LKRKLQLASTRLTDISAMIKVKNPSLLQQIFKGANINNVNIQASRKNQNLKGNK
jgi:hypothetical protein